MKIVKFEKSVSNINRIIPNKYFGAKSLAAKILCEELNKLGRKAIYIDKNNTNGSFCGHSIVWIIEGDNLDYLKGYETCKKFGEIYD